MGWHRSWTNEPIPGVSLDAAGLVALADLSTISQRTVLVGGASWLDILTLCPGMHMQYKANELNKGEHVALYPACAALTTGYVFRLENPATINFLQRSGKTGCLTTIKVSHPSSSAGPIVPILLVWTTYLMTLFSLSFLIACQDYWAFSILAMLMVSRWLNVVVVRRRTYRGSIWKGQAEPNEKADLFVLGSQDRWFRIWGAVDDVKKVTSGQWTADPTFIESCVISVATLLVYLSAALAANSSQLGNVLLVGLLLSNSALLALANDQTKVLRMFGLELHIFREAKSYKRRRDLADELIEQTGDRTWAVSLGLVPPQRGETVGEAVM